MALSATGVFEVDGGHAGASDASNAGYFNPAGSGAGTDYSIQNPIACTDLAIDGADNTKVSSASIGFTTDHRRNGLRITAGSGFTTGLYEITAVSGGVATLDRAAGTTGSTGGTARVGGPFATPGQAAALKIASNLVYLKTAGTPTVYTLSASSNVAGGRIIDSTNGSQTAPNFWIGYNTTRSILNTDAVRPILKANANSVTCFSGTGQYVCIHNIDFGNNGSFTSVNGVNLSSNFGRVWRSKATACTATGLTGSSASTGFYSIECDTCGTGITPGASHVDDFKIYNGTGLGVNASGVGAVLSRGLIYGCVGNGITVGSNGNTFRNITIAGCGHGMVFNSGTANNIAVNVLCWGATGSGSRNFHDGSTPAGLSNLLIRCAGGGGDTADNFTADQMTGFLALSANPFKDAAGGDYAPNEASGGGALVRGAGSNGEDIGAIQAPRAAYFAY